MNLTYNQTKMMRKSLQMKAQALQDAYAEYESSYPEHPLKWTKLMEQVGNVILHP